MAYLDKNRGLWEVLEPITETFIKTRMGDLKSTVFLPARGTKNMTVLETCKVI